MPRQPLLVREARQLVALATEALVALEGARGVAPAGPPPAPETMLVRHLGLEHLGRWVYLPGKPALIGPRAIQEPSITSVGGRLIGLRAGKVGQHDQPGTRVLVLAQGSALAELSISVADRVDVAPREW